MNKSKRREIKKKERDRLVKEKMHHKRLKLRAEMKRVDTENRKELDAKRLMNQQLTTLSYGTKEKKTPSEIREQLERNMKTLEALEQEHEGLMKTREEFLRQLQEQQDANRNWGGAAGVEFTPFHTEEDKLKYEKEQKEKEEEIKRLTSNSA
jgi:hypothetical protein